VQQWKGYKLNPVQFRVARERKHDGPSETDQLLAPESILKLVSYGCKAGCGKKSGCWKLGLNCNAMCSQCEGQTYKNIAALSDEDRIK